MTQIPLHIISLVLVLFGFSNHFSNPDQALDKLLYTIEPEEFVETLNPLFEYNWTAEEIYYAALLVQTEGGGLGRDGMLSILSVPYARFMSPNWCQSYYCSRTLLEEMQRPGQYLGPEVALEMGINYSDVSHESIVTVYRFILGQRGSCSNFEYFNSYVGGRCDCKIETPDGQFTEFWSTIEFEENQREGYYRNINRNSDPTYYIGNYIVR